MTSDIIDMSLSGVEVVWAAGPLVGSLAAAGVGDGLSGNSGMGVTELGKVGSLTGISGVAWTAT